MSLFERDWLKRQLAELAEAVGRAVGAARTEENIDEALDLLEREARERFGLSPETLDRLDATSVRMMVGDPERMAAWIWILERRAELLEARGDGALAQALRDRAAALGG